MKLLMWTKQGDFDAILEKSKNIFFVDYSFQ